MGGPWIPIFLSCDPCDVFQLKLTAGAAQPDALPADRLHLAAVLEDVGAGELLEELRLGDRGLLLEDLRPAATTSSFAVVPSLLGLSHLVVQL